MKKKYGLIGYPLKHSFSQKFFTNKFLVENIDAEYLNFEIPSIDEFTSIIKDNADLVGLNVTIPYKEAVMPFLDRIDDEAKRIGAINVIKIEREKDQTMLTGYNSDIVGFQYSISPLIEPHHKKALILGTGGASKAVIEGLKNIGIESTHVSRGKKQENTFLYSELTEEIFKEYTVIVNSSPVGTFPNIDEYPDIPYQYITEKHLLYDLVYNPSQTTFLKKGAEQGAIIKNGAEMLELQAIEAWDTWNK